MGGFTANFAVGDAFVVGSNDAYVVDVGKGVIKLGDKICVGSNTVCQTVSALDCKVLSTLTVTDVNPRAGNTLTGANGGVGIVVAAAADTTLIAGIADTDPIYFHKSGAILHASGAEAITAAQGSGVAAPSAGVAGNSAGNPTDRLETFCLVTVSSGFATAGAYNDALYVEHVDRSILSTGGGDQLVTYQSGANNGATFGTLEGTNTQTDTTVVFDYATATATDAPYRVAHAQVPGGFLEHGQHRLLQERDVRDHPRHHRGHRVLRPWQLRRRERHLRVLQGLHGTGLPDADCSPVVPVSCAQTTVVERQAKHCMIVFLKKKTPRRDVNRVR